MARKNVNTTLNESLYKNLKSLALQLDVNANDLLEEGINLIFDKYGYTPIRFKTTIEIINTSKKTKE